MMEKESYWIRNKLDFLKLKQNCTVLDIGSSTEEYRKKIKPHIDKNIFSYLKSKDIIVHHLDKKKGKGIDIVCDIEEINKINSKYDLVICANLLEHIKNPKYFIKKVIKLVDKKGYLIITVPHNYIYHPDPLDTMYRPSNKDLEKLVPGLKVIFSEIVKNNFRFNLISILGSFKNILRDKKFCFIVRNIKAIFNKMTVSCLVVKK